MPPPFFLEIWNGTPCLERQAFSARTCFNLSLNGNLPWRRRFDLPIFASRKCVLAQKFAEHILQKGQITKELPDRLTDFAKSTLQKHGEVHNKKELMLRIREKTPNQGRETILVLIKSNILSEVKKKMQRYARKRYFAYFSVLLPKSNNILLLTVYSKLPGIDSLGSTLTHSQYLNVFSASSYYGHHPILLISAWPLWAPAKG